MITDNVIDKLSCSSYSPTPGHSREVLLDHLYSDINRDTRYLENVPDKLIQNLLIVLFTPWAFQGGATRPPLL